MLDTQKTDRDSLLYSFVSKGDIKPAVDKFLLHLHSCACSQVLFIVYYLCLKIVKKRERNVHIQIALFTLYQMLRHILQSPVVWIIYTIEMIRQVYRRTPMLTRNRFWVLKEYSDVEVASYFPTETMPIFLMFQRV